MATIGVAMSDAETIDGSRNVHQDIMVETMRRVNIERTAHLHKCHHLRVVATAVMSPQRALPLDRVLVDVMSLLHRLVPPGRCSNPHQGLDHQATRFRIPTMVG
jgi:hypothetical protein